MNSDGEIVRHRDGNMTARASILFVDDEQRVLNSMRGLFRRDFELFLATEGAAAVKLAAEHTIDVVVADQRMPGMSGIDVLDKVRELSPETIRILLTGYADQDAVADSINVGEVFRFLSKPCPPGVLRDTLNLAVAAARATRASSIARFTGVARRPAALPEQPGLQAAAGAATPATSSPPNGRAVFTADGRDTPVPQGKGDRPIRLVPPVSRPPNTVADDDGSESSLEWQTITDVVLSGESSTESRPGEIGANTLAMTKDIGVVIFTIDPNFAETTIRAVSADRSTTVATSLSRVAHAVEKHQAGVLITDYTANSAVLQKMIGVLKRYLPQLVTIVVSGGRDTSDMINLINYGQVFRYLLKPIDAENLRNDINAAAIRHMHLLNHPELIKRHHVERLPGQAEPSATLDEFAGKVRQMQSRRIMDNKNSN